MTKRYGAALAALLIFSGLCARTDAAVPGTLSYQGTLRNNGALVTGTVAMEFRITSADGVTQYWTSGSTNVPVSAGLFRYALGIPNEAQFAAIPWKDITPYVQMVVDGSPFPREPLYASAYAQHARTAESSTGTFTAYDGDIRISTSAGSRGLVFQDGTVQYTAAGWSVSGQNTVLAVSGGAGIGVASPESRLDVQAAAAAAYSQIWRNSSGAAKSSMSASGLLYSAGLHLNDADANAATSGVRFLNFNCAGTAKLTVDTSGNLVCSADQTGGGTGGDNVVDTLTDTLGAGNNAGGQGILNLGNTALGLASPETRLDVQAGGDGYAQFWRDSGGTIVSSMNAAGVLYADAAGLRGLPLGADSLGSHIATTTLRMGGFDIVNAGGITAAGQFTSYSSVTVAGSGGLAAAGLSLAPGVGLSSAASAQYGGVYVSTHVYLPAGAVYYGSGAGLTALSASNISAGSLADGRLSANVALLGANQSFSGDNTFTGLFSVAGSTGAAAARLQLNATVGLSSATSAQYGGVYVSSHVYLPAGAVYYGSGAGLTALSASNITAGSLADGRLSSNVPLLNAANTFAGSLTVTSPLGAAANRLQFNSMAGISSTTAANYGGVYVSTHVYLPAGAKYYGDGSELSGVNGTDDLGSHIMTANLQTGAFWLSSDGGAEGLSVNSLGGVGVGVNPATARLEVNDGDADTNTSGMKFTDFSCVSPAKLTVDVSGNLICAADQTGSGTGNLIDTLSETLGAGSNAGGLGMANVGDLALGLATAGTRLDVQSGGADQYAQFWRNSAGTIVASMSVSGVLYADADGLRGVTGTDNLGNHALTQNLSAGAFWLSGDGGAEGLSVNSLGNVGVGVNPATVRLEVNDGDADTNTSGMKFTDFSCVSPAKLTVDVSGNLICAADQTGSGTGNLIDTLSETLGAGNNAGGAGIANLGSVAMGLATAGTRLDVQAGGVDQYAQFWRNSSGVIVASMSAAGVLFADGAGIRGAAGTDNLGNHTATANLDMSGFRVQNAPAVAFNTSAEISSTTAANYGGIYVSTHVYLPAGAKYYGDGSELSGVNGTDDLGSHIMTANLQTGAFWISSDGGAEGLSVNSLGNVGVGVNPAAARLEVNDGDADTNTSGMKFTDFSCVSPAKLTVDVSGNLICAADQTGSGTGNLIDTLSETLGAGNNAGGVGITNLGSLALGLGTAGTRLDVQADGGGYSQIWRDSGGTIRSSMSAAGVLYAEASGLRGLTLATTLADGNSAGGIGITNLGSVAIGLGAAAAQLDVQASGVNAQFWRNSGGTIVSSMTNAGVLYAEVSGLRGLTLAATLAGGNSAGGTGITNLGNLGVGRAAAADVRLDIQAGGSDEYMQVWRAPDGTVVSSMSAGGEFFAEASGLRGLPPDGLGNHSATQDLDMGGFTLGNAPRLELTPDVSISSTSEDFHGGVGVLVSSNVFIVGIASATKFYGDGSGLTNITGGSVTGMANPATADLNMAGNNVYGILSIAATNASITNVQAAVLNTTQPQLTVSTDVYVAGRSAFGNGIPAPSTFSAVSIFQSYAGDSRDNMGLNVFSELTPPANNMWAYTTGGGFVASMPDNDPHDSGILRGVYSLAQARNASTLRYAAGFMGGVTKTNDGAISEAFGGYFSVNTAYAPTGSTILNAYGVYTMNYAAYPTALITNSFGVYVDSPTAGTLDNFTNIYGVYINDHSEFGSEKSYNLYSAGSAANNHFDGKVSIGTETSVAPLAIQTDSSSRVMNIQPFGGPAVSCVLKLSNSTDCSGVGGTSLGTNNNHTLCLLCS